MEHRDPLTESDLAIFSDSERIAAPGGERDRNNREPLSTGKGQRKEPVPAGNRVLLFSGIFEVALYRAEVLRAHGLEVRTPRTKDEAVAIIQRGEVDVMVLTYTLPSETVHELSDLVRQYCRFAPNRLDSSSRFTFSRSWYTRFGAWTASARSAVQSPGPDTNRSRAEGS
jgi:hypothetical protein